MTRFARLASARDVYVELAAGTALPGEGHVLSRAPWLGGARTGEILGGVGDDGTCAGARRLAPVEPSKIVCIGRNYRAHAAELGNAVPAEPLLFMKPPSALLEPDGVLELPPARLTERVEHEVELAFVVGRRLRRATPEQAAAAIFGFTIACDVTARDLQKRDGQWTRAKGFDGFCPVGPVVVTGLDATALSIEARVNGAVRQQGSTGAMVFAPAHILAYASAVMTFEPGDLVLTGTPEGVGPLVAGDRVELAISGIGALCFSVRAGES